MTPERYEEVRRIFVEVVELDGDERAAYLDDACASDPTLRAEVESLLEAGASDPVRSIVDRAMDDLHRAPDVPGYEILGLLGRGGMGEVYDARQAYPARRVALKVIRRDMSSASSLDRFRREIDVLGRLRHPGIVHVLDAGVTGGTPWFTMDLVEGVDLRAFLRDHEVSDGARWALLLQVCDALAHAHQRGVVHRDLKPANIMVEGDASAPRVRLLDFGVARLVEDREVTVATQAGALIGTLQFMSPEQARGDDVDTRTDVHAVGAIAYEVFAGRPPFEFDGLTITAAIRRLEAEDPRPLGSIRPDLAGDPAAIIRKAMEKDRDRRYEGVGAMAADIRRLLEGRAISARAPTAWYLARRFAGRHRALVGGAATTVLALAVGFTMTVVFAVREARQRQAEQARAAELQVVTEFQADLIERLDAGAMGMRMIEAIREGLDVEDGAEDLASFESIVGRVNPTDIALVLLDEHLLAPAIETIDREFASQPGTDAALRQTVADAYRAIGLYDRAL
ncbi:MAG: serine/threonine protein kinase, partial [Phycisphaerales bacterium]|nr:serine/threonine protein kinase [Phycisphaerales bacterium]